jgi:hypothetical protein
VRKELATPGPQGMSPSPLLAPRHDSCTWASGDLVSGDGCSELAFVSGVLFLLPHVQGALP